MEGGVIRTQNIVPYNAFGVDDGNMRNPEYAIIAVETGGLAEYYLPGNAAVLDEFFHQTEFLQGVSLGHYAFRLSVLPYGVSALQTGNTYNLNIVVFVSFLQGPDIGEGSETGSAPGCPEIQNNDLTFVCRQILCLSLTAPDEFYFRSLGADQLPAGISGVQ